LWEARANLIAKYGFTNGNELILRLVMDGMKLCPPSPNFLEARDAILLADRAYPGADNWDELWAAFAKRGMGMNATIVEHFYGGNYSDVVEDFSTPPPQNSDWTFNFGGSFQGSPSAPAMGADGTIYFGSANGYVFALYPDGSLKWRFPNGVSLAAFNSTPAIAPTGEIYIGCDNAKLYCLRPDGTEKWSYPANSAVQCAPVVGTDGTVYFASTSGKFYAVMSDGTLRSGWNSIDYTGPINASPVFGPDSSLQGTIYFGYAGGLVALSPGGGLRWARPLPAVKAGPALGDNGVLYVGCSDQKLYFINADSGDVIWSSPALNGQIVVSPVIGQDVGQDVIVYVGTDQGMVYAYTNSNKLLRWSYSMGSPIRGCPIVGSADELHVGTDAGIFSLLTTFQNGNGVVQVIPRKTLAAGETITAPPLLRRNGTLLQVTNQRLNAWHNIGFPADAEWPTFQRDAQRMGNSAFID
jgi:outer membrane protein assembly factor BamB